MYVGRKSTQSWYCLLILRKESSRWGEVGNTCQNTRQRSGQRLCTLSVMSSCLIRQDFQPHPVHWQWMAPLSVWKAISKRRGFWVFLQDLNGTPHALKGGVWDTICLHLMHSCPHSLKMMMTEEDLRMVEEALINLVNVAQMLGREASLVSATLSIATFQMMAERKDWTYVGATI